MTNAYSIRVFNLDVIFKSSRIFKIIPLLIAGAVGLGAGIIGSKMFGKKDDEDERQREQEERYKRFEQRQRMLEADRRRLDEMESAQNETSRQEELMRKKLALEAALSKNVVQEDIQDQKLEANNKSDLNSQKLDEAWMDNLKNFYKKKRKAASLSHE